MLPKIDTSGGRGVLLEQLRCQEAREGVAARGGYGSGSSSPSKSRPLAHPSPLPKLKLLRHVIEQGALPALPPPGRFPRRSIPPSVDSGGGGDESATFDGHESRAASSQATPARGRGLLRPVGSEHGGGCGQKLRSQSPPPPESRASTQHPLDYEAMQGQARERVREHNRRQRRHRREEEERKQLEEQERRARAEAALPAIEEHRKELARRAAEQVRRDRAAKESAILEEEEALTERRERKQMYKTPEQRRRMRRPSGRTNIDTAGTDACDASDFRSRDRGRTREPARRRRRGPPSRGRDPKNLAGASPSPASSSRYTSTPARGGWGQGSAAERFES